MPSPWCDFHSYSLAAVLEHKRDEHDFLEGVAPPVNPELTIQPKRRASTDE